MSWPATLHLNTVEGWTQDTKHCCWETPQGQLSRNYMLPSMDHKHIYQPNGVWIHLPGLITSSNFSILLQLRRATDASLLPDLSITTPGQSSSLTFLSKWTSCIDLVKPGVAPTFTTWARFKLLIKLLLPTLGNPIIPTVIDFLICKEQHRTRFRVAIMKIINTHKFKIRSGLKKYLKKKSVDHIGFNY